MKQLSHLAVSFACAAAQAQPVVINVPQRDAWCASSQPVELKADSGGTRFGDLLFFELYDRVERAALAAGVASIGVPFLESMEEQAAPPAPTVPTPLSTAPATPASSAPITSPPPPPPRFVMRVCANVPTGSAAPPVSLRIEAIVLTAATVYASLCEAADEGTCREQIQKRLQSDLKMAPDLSAKLDWRVSQSIDGKGDATSVMASLMDTTVRPLVEGKSGPNVPRDRLIVWAVP